MTERRLALVVVAVFATTLLVVAARRPIMVAWYAHRVGYGPPTSGTVDDWDEWIGDVEALARWGRGDPTARSTLESLATSDPANPYVVRGFIATIDDPDERLRRAAAHIEREAFVDVDWDGPKTLPEPVVREVRIDAPVVLPMDELVTIEIDVVCPETPELFSVETVRVERPFRHRGAWIDERLRLVMSAEEMLGYHELFVVLTLADARGEREEVRIELPTMHLFRTCE